MRHTHNPALLRPTDQHQADCLPALQNICGLIQRAPLPAGLKGEMRTFECKKCGNQTKIIVKD